MRKLLRSAVLATALLAPATAALAQSDAQTPVITDATVRVGVTFDPWTPRAVPPPRAGYVWVGGHWSHGYWVPGYYRPVERRRGYAFEPGYWREGVYVDGYWRPARQTGWYWSPGHYSGRGWIPGHWVRR